MSDDFNVLVVEDDPIIGLFLSKDLKDLGYSVTSICSSSTDALRALQQKNVDFILMDIRIKGKLDGIALTKLINDQYGIPVIFLTAHSDDATIKRAKDTVAYGYIIKPYNIQILKVTIEMAMNKVTADRKIGHLSRILRAINSVGQIMREAKDLPTLVQDICDRLVNLDCYRHVWIDLKNENGSPAGFGFASSDRNAGQLRDSIASGFAPYCEKVIMDRAEQNIIIINPDDCPACDLRTGYANNILIKLVQDGVLHGVMHVCPPGTTEVSRDETSLLEELASNISYAIHVLKLDAKRRETEAEKRTIQTVTIFSLAKLAELRDRETGNHLWRIRKYSLALALELKKNSDYSSYISENYLGNIYNSSPLHDIGKIGIPDNVLFKPGKYTTDEFSIMKRHTLIGGQALEEAESQLSREIVKDTFLSMAKFIAFYHHEHWNGKGYPYGLSKEDIPLSARIVALTDVYDALTSKRIYKEAISHEEAIRIINDENETHFDPAITESFNRIGDEFKTILHDFNE